MSREEPASVERSLEYIEQSVAQIARSLEPGSEPDRDGPVTICDQLTRIADAVESLVPIAERLAAALESLGDPVDD